jgi:tetratricopeptide (TPR) repeat protein
MKLLILLFLLSSSFLTAQESGEAEQRLDQLKQQVIETMRNEGPAKAGELVKEYLDKYSDSKAVFYLAWNYYQVGEFEDAEFFARPLTVNSEPSIRASSNLLLGKIYSVYRTDENNPVYYLTASLMEAQKHNLLRVAYSTHLSLVYWYSEQNQHDLSELHLKEAQSLMHENGFDKSRYYLHEFMRLMSLGAYRPAKKSALLMFEEKSSGDYKPYYAINLAMIQILLLEYDQAKSTLEEAKKVLESRNDNLRLEIIETLFEAINYCEGGKKSLQADSVESYPTNAANPDVRRMGRYIQLIFERCK